MRLLLYFILLLFISVFSKADVSFVDPYKDPSLFSTPPPSTDPNSPTAALDTKEELNSRIDSLEQNLRINHKYIQDLNDALSKVRDDAVQAKSRRSELQAEITQLESEILHARNAKKTAFIESRVQEASGLLERLNEMINE